MTRTQRINAIDILVDNIPEHLRTALAESTNRKHAAKALQIVEEMNSGATVPEAIVSIVTQSRTKGATKANLLGSLIGAVRDAKLMGITIPPQPHLSQDPAIKRLNRIVNKQIAREAGSINIYAARSREVWGAIDAIQAMPRTQLTAFTALYIAMWWTLAARSGDAILLHSDHVFAEETSLKARFVEGKVVAICGPVTTHTVPLSSAFQRMLPTTGYIFPEAMRPEIQVLAMSELKKQNPRIEARSLRRGSLTEMAINGATDTQLLRFSHHKSLEMLYRYLGWGMHSRLATEEGISAAQVLLHNLV
jgi:hypothetical protein